MSPVVTNVRALGDELGMSKDAVATALRRLMRAGLVRRTPQGRGDSGLFTPGSYLLDGEALVDVLTRVDGLVPKPNGGDRKKLVGGLGQASLFQQGVGA